MDLLQKVKITQIEMLRDRGFDIGPEKKVLSLSLVSFEKHFRREAERLEVKLGSSLIRPVLNRLYYTPDRSKSIYVYYAGNGDPQKAKYTTVETARNYMSLLTRSNPTNSILILNRALSPVAKKEVYRYMARRGIEFQIFYEKDLTYNPTHHQDVPVHIKLSEEEKIEKMRLMRVQITDLPLLRADDPIAKYYAWSQGDLIQIRHTHQSNLISDQSLNYRVVIAPYVQMNFTLEDGATVPQMEEETDSSKMVTRVEAAILPADRVDTSVDYLSYN